MINTLLHIMGVDDVSGRWYAFWSGFAGDIALLATPFVLLRKHNCHVRHCWRIGRHTQDGKAVCSYHHQSGDIHGQQ